MKLRKVIWRNSIKCCCDSLSTNYCWLSDTKSQSGQKSHRKEAIVSVYAMHMHANIHLLVTIKSIHNKRLSKVEKVEISYLPQKNDMPGEL